MEIQGEKAKKGENRHFAAIITILFIGFFTFALYKKAQVVDTNATEISSAEQTTFAMNTFITTEAYGGDAHEGVMAAEERLLELDKLWSVTNPESEVWKINHEQGKPVAISSDTESLLSFALWLAEGTGGSLNPAIYPLVQA